MRRSPWLLLLLSACRIGYAPMDYAMFCEAQWDTLAARAAECLGGSRALWREHLATQADRYCFEGTRLLNANRIAYNQDRARNCIEALRTKSCFPDPLEMDSVIACRDVVYGTLPAGAPCYATRECLPDHFCTASDTSCPGFCQAYRLLGQPCGAGEYCQPNTFCDDPSGLGGICQSSISGEGQVCGPAPDPPFQFLTCESNLYCNQALARCERRVGAFQPCPDQDDACPARHRCMGGSCLPLAEVGEPCQPGGCEALSYCGAGALCVESPRRGMACGIPVAGDPSRCIDSWCNVGVGTDGTCQPYKYAGPVTSPGDTCDPGNDPDLNPECGPPGTAFCSLGSGRCIAACAFP
jgi:hypothetical protein